jgi:hypothetical protein
MDVGFGLSPVIRVPILPGGYKNLKFFFGIIENPVENEGIL